MKWMDMINPQITPNAEFDYLDTRLRRSNYVHFPLEMPDGVEPRETAILFFYDDGKYLLKLDDDIICSDGHPALDYLQHHQVAQFQNMNELRDFFRTGFTRPAASSVSRRSAHAPMPETDRNALDLTPQRRNTVVLEPEQLFRDLTETVRGQDEAVRSVVRYACAAAAKESPKKPPSLMLAGKTGQGKTLVGKNLAEAMNRQIPNRARQYGTIVINCNELTENHDVSRLTGASPSYVGYDDDISLTPVRTNPYQVIVFDEIEKAAPRVLDVLMGALDCGEIMLAKPVDGNNMLDLSRCILIFTTNLRVDAGRPTKKHIGFMQTAQDAAPRTEQTDQSEDLSTKYRNALVAAGMRREIAARFSDIICFKELAGDAIVDILMKEIQSCAEEYGLTIGYIAPEILQGLYDALQIDGFGARMIVRLVAKRFDLLFADQTKNDHGGTYDLIGTYTAPMLTLRD